MNKKKFANSMGKKAIQLHTIHMNRTNFLRASFFVDDFKIKTYLNCNKNVYRRRTFQHVYFTALFNIRVILV